jgi:hypothetical protein
MFSRTINKPNRIYTRNHQERRLSLITLIKFITHAQPLFQLPVFTSWFKGMTVASTITTESVGIAPQGKVLSASVTPSPAHSSSVLERNLLRFPLAENIEFELRRQNMFKAVKQSRARAHHV